MYLKIVSPPPLETLELGYQQGRPEEEEERKPTPFQEFPNRGKKIPRFSPP